MSQKIRIKLKSYDYNLVDKSAEKIVKTVKSTGAVVNGPIPLPTHKKIFTDLGIKETEDMCFSILSFSSSPGDIKKELVKEKEKALKRKVKRLRVQL